MNPLFEPSVPAVTFWIVVKATVLMVAVVLLQVALRRASAAGRYFVWLTALAAIAALPAATWLLPPMPLAVASAPQPVVVERSSEQPLVEDRAAADVAGESVASEYSLSS